LSKYLHIVCLDVPYPVDYGGVVDLFYKLKALHQLGIKIYLHCFTNGRQPQQELNQYCETVTYYARKKNSQSISLKLPFIVKSRINEQLITNLQKDNHPVLLEGIHCTYYLHNGELQGRKVFIRLHNAEFEYYRQLAKHERNFLKKIFFLHESQLLRRYEKNITTKAPIIAVSQQDADLYKQLFGAGEVHHVPVFIPHTLAVGKTGVGCYCLYHGNLEVNENETAAIWLLQNVFNTLQIPFVIAGKNPGKKLLRLAHEHKHTCIVANPSHTEMQDMIAKAQVHVLPSFNNTGVKLKLMNALFNGRHCVVNSNGVVGSGLQTVCHIASNAAAFIIMVQQLYEQPFSENEKEQRQGLLLTLYNNEANAKKLSSFL
jgi:hypothetical protein